MTVHHHLDRILALTQLLVLRTDVYRAGVLESSMQALSHDERKNFVCDVALVFFLVDKKDNVVIPLFRHRFAI